jgi:hypothetical protein
LSSPSGTKPRPVQKVVAEILPRIRVDMELGKAATCEQSGHRCCL